MPKLSIDRRRFLTSLAAAPIFGRVIDRRPPGPAPRKWNPCGPPCVQTHYYLATPTEGTFTITVNGKTTSQISHKATPDEIRAAVAALIS
jgi:hypothetical protein